jgi:uncharacterized protein with ATP-grasp and redox domains
VHTEPACLACFLRQGVDVSLLVPPGEARDALVAEISRLTAEADLSTPPVATCQAVHRRLRQLTGAADPYGAAKRVFNNLVLDLLPELRAMIRAAPDPLLAAVRLAIVGNVIDFGPSGSLTPADALRALRGALREPFWADWHSFDRALTAATRLLYLTDNAGEIVVDRLLIELIGPRRVTVAVRGAAVLDDATIDDARYTGLDRLVEVIDSGSDAPGVLLDDCSARFRERFAAADMIIAKGQGNFESLGGLDRPLFFLLKVKCAVMARHVGQPIGTHALIDGARWRSGGAADPGPRPR